MPNKAMCGNGTLPHIVESPSLWSRIRSSRRGCGDFAQNPEIAGQAKSSAALCGSDRLRCGNLKPVALGALVRKVSPRTCADTEELSRTVKLEQNSCIRSIAR